MGRITEEQLKILDTFSCERLSEHAENKSLIMSFSNKRGKGLISFLQKKAWQEDIEGKTATYLIKSAQGEIVLFFSLKCGALFDPIDEAQLKERIEWTNRLLQNIQQRSTDAPKEDLASQIIELLRSGSGIPLEELQQHLKTNTRETKWLLSQIHKDKKQEQNKKIVRVGSTYPAIDLVNFCANESSQVWWKTFGINHSMGEVIFWRFVVPIVFETQKWVGCQYLFLFAADISQDETLINYYNVGLKFEKLLDLGTSKPQYDLCCQFMCQDIQKLKENHENYFNSFNPDEEDVIV